MKPAGIPHLIAVAGLTFIGIGQTALADAHPNILIAISDDQSYLHTSAAGCAAVRTPVFDRVAHEGILFRNCFAASPGCSPSRASLLTGRHPWEIEQAGTHDSSFPTNYVAFPDLLEANGYAVGFTGKGWGPGNWKISGRTRNPAGPEFGKRKLAPPTIGISRNDYAANFKDFLATRTNGQPFCFWYGGHEPHRDYEKGSGLKFGKRLTDVVVPPSLPDTPEVRSDFLDYCLEIEWFDTQLGKMLKLLEAAGELDNTIVIVTADNGMPFPRAKANCYEDGIHVPLAIRWGAQVPGGRTVDGIVGFVDLTATMLAATGTKPPTTYPLSGHSLLNTLTATNQGLVDPANATAWAARERHSSSRYTDNLVKDGFSLLGGYLGRSASVFACPAGSMVSPIQAQAGWTRRCRSVSMDAALGGGFKHVLYDNYTNPPLLKITDVHSPGPADAWLFMDEHPDFIDDGIIYFPVNPLDSILNATRSLSEIPGAQHGGATGVTFLDGHSEMHSWAGSMLFGLQKVQFIKYAAPAIKPNDPGLKWLCDHTAYQ